jgi:hypothetical protein
VNLTKVIGQVLEYSGNSMNPLDAVNFGSGSGTTASEAVSASLTNELIWACGYADTTSAFLSPGGGWIDPTGGVHPQSSSIYNIETASGSYTPTFSVALSSSWGVIACAFKSPGAAYTISGGLGSAGARAPVYFISTTTGIAYSSIADSSGNYVSPALEADTYTVQPNKVGTIYTPMSVVISNANVTQNFTGTRVATSLRFTTLASDTFVRANENPLNPSNWTVDGSPIPPYDPPLQVLNDKCVMSDATIIANFAGPYAADGIDTFTGISWPNNQWAEVQLDALGFGSQDQSLMAIIFRSDVPVDHGYLLRVGSNGDGTANLVLSYFSSGGLSNAILVQLPAVPFSAGDKFRCVAAAQGLYVLRNSIILANVQDLNILSGTVGLQAQGTVIENIQMSNF